jgi:hypothetical protein
VVVARGKFAEVPKVLKPLALFRSVVAEQLQSKVGGLDTLAHKGQLDVEHVGEAARRDAVAMLAGRRRQPLDHAGLL